MKKATAGATCQELAEKLFAAGAQAIVRFLETLAADMNDWPMDGFSAPAEFFSFLHDYQKLLRLEADPKVAEAIDAADRRIASGEAPVATFAEFREHFEKAVAQR
jgi:hypothetical protein